MNEKLSGFLETWVDCQKTFGEKMDAERHFGLEEALIATGIMPDGSDAEDYWEDW